MIKGNTETAPDVYLVDDCNWVAARSAEEARNFYLDYIGEDSIHFYREPKVVSRDALEKLTFVDDPYNPDRSSRRSFAEELTRRLDAGGAAPFGLASTEY